MQDDIRGFLRLASAVGQSLAERAVDAADAVAAATGLDRVVQPRRVVNHLAGLAESVVVAADAARRQAVGAVTGRPSDDEIALARLAQARGPAAHAVDVVEVPVDHDGPRPGDGRSPEGRSGGAEVVVPARRRPPRAAVRARARGGVDGAAEVSVSPAATRRPAEGSRAAGRAGEEPSAPGAKAATTKKAPAKSTPATKPATTKATAKKATATKATATKAATKRAPTTKATATTKAATTKSRTTKATTTKGGARKSAAGPLTSKKTTSRSAGRAGTDGDAG